MALAMLFVVAAFFVIAAMQCTVTVCPVSRVRRHSFPRSIVGMGLSNRAASKVAHNVKLGRHVLVGGTALAISKARAGYNSLVRDVFGSLAEATVEGARIRRSYRETSSLVRGIMSLNQNQLGRRVAQTRRELGIVNERVSTSNHQNRRNHSANRQAYRSLLRERMALIPETIVSINESIVETRRLRGSAPREWTWAYNTRTRRAIESRRAMNKTQELILQDRAWVYERAQSINVDSYEVGIASILPELQYPEVETKETVPCLYGEISRRTVRARCQTTVAGRSVAIELKAVAS